MKEIGTCAKITIPSSNDASKIELEGKKRSRGFFRNNEGFVHRYAKEMKSRDNLNSNSNDLRNLIEKKKEHEDLENRNKRY